MVKKGLLDHHDVCIEYDVYICVDCSVEGCGKQHDDKIEGITPPLTERDMKFHLDHIGWSYKRGKIICGDHGGEE